MFWYWSLAKLNVKLSEEPIPDNTYYCYVPDEEKNNNKDKDDHSFYTKPCKYYKHLGGNRTGCGYLGEIMNFDALHWDQCKICGIKEFDINEDDTDYVSDDYVG